MLISSLKRTVVEAGGGGIPKLRLALRHWVLKIRALLRNIPLYVDIYWNVFFIVTKPDLQCQWQELGSGGV